MLLNIHPAYRSSLHSMQLLLVAKVVDIKRYGFDAVIKPAMEDLQRLAKDVSTCTCTLYIPVHVCRCISSISYTVIVHIHIKLNVLWNVHRE